MGKKRSIASFSVIFGSVAVSAGVSFAVLYGTGNLDTNKVQYTYDVIEQKNDVQFVVNGEGLSSQKSDYELKVNNVLISNWEIDSSSTDKKLIINFSYDFTYVNEIVTFRIISNGEVFQFKYPNLTSLTSLTVDSGQTKTTNKVNLVLNGINLPLTKDDFVVEANGTNLNFELDQSSTNEAIVLVIDYDQTYAGQPINVSVSKIDQSQTSTYPWIPKISKLITTFDPNTFKVKLELSGSYLTMNESDYLVTIDPTQDSNWALDTNASTSDHVVLSKDFLASNVGKSISIQNSNAFVSNVSASYPNLDISSKESEIIQIINDNQQSISNATTTTDLDLIIQTMNTNLMALFDNKYGIQSEFIQKTTDGEIYQDISFDVKFNCDLDGIYQNFSIANTKTLSYNGSSISSQINKYIPDGQTLIIDDNVLGIINSTLVEWVGKNWIENNQDVSIYNTQIIEAINNALPSGFPKVDQIGTWESRWNDNVDGFKTVKIQIKFVNNPTIILPANSMNYTLQNYNGKNLLVTAPLKTAVPAVPQLSGSEMTLTQEHLDTLSNVLTPLIKQYWTIDASNPEAGISSENMVTLIQEANNQLEGWPKISSLSKNENNFPGDVINGHKGVQFFINFENVSVYHIPSNSGWEFSSSYGCLERIKSWESGIVSSN